MGKDGRERKSVEMEDGVRWREVELRESGEKRLSICAFALPRSAVEERVLSIQRCLALLLPM